MWCRILQLNENYGQTHQAAFILLGKVEEGGMTLLEGTWDYLTQLPTETGITISAFFQMFVCFSFMCDWEVCLNGHIFLE